MDLNSKSVEEKIRQYRVFKSCSQSTLMGLCEVANHPMSQARLCALASGFSGGIGGTFDEGTCGALTGALIALGFLEDDEIKIKMDAKKLYDAFKKEYGSVQCGIISKDGEDKSLTHNDYRSNLEHHWTPEKDYFYFSMMASIYFASHMETLALHYLFLAYEV